MSFLSCVLLYYLHMYVMPCMTAHALWMGGRQRERVEIVESSCNRYQRIQCATKMEYIYLLHS